MPRFQKGHKVNLGRKNPGKLGKSPSEKTRKRIANKLKNRHISPKTEFKKGHNIRLNKRHSEETKKKIREATIRYLSSGKMKNKETSIELKLENELRRQRIPYMKQVPLERIAIVDFLLPDKIIIQADGEYWHSREKRKGRDIVQDTILGFKGYRIYRFTEAEINKSAKRCINKIFGGCYGSELGK